MKGASVKIETSKEKTIVNWTYNGSLSIKPKKFTITPGFGKLYDAQSFALAGLFPLIAVANETVLFEDSVPKNVADFWYTKMSSLSSFYKSSMKCAIEPVSEELVISKRGNNTALFMGCGADALSTLGLLLKQGIKPHLVLILERAHKECFEGSLRTVFTKQLARDFKLDLSIVESNLWFFGLTEINKYLKKDSRINILKRGNTALANTNVIRGFRMFFSALAGLPEDIGHIIMGSSLEDRSEWFGLGFNHENTLPYIGLSLETMPWKTKIEQYAYLYDTWPEFIKYQKTCVNPSVRWCGKCFACNIAHCMQLAIGYKEPIKAARVKCFDRAGINMMKSALDYYKGEDQEIIVELKDRMLNTQNKGLLKYAKIINNQTK